ncbi:MAG: Holliday junction DNA helicase RuvA [Desulfobacteraceae bacterium]|nr:MAG: Holliday junction DNA helicase RuvA [Desulfobacteraceae bacterium]
MIGYLEGKIIHTEADRILLQAGPVGYEVVINAFVLDTIIREYSEQDDICLYIYFHQTERQPKPVLIGFTTLTDKEFFQQFITVDAIGPLKAIKALDRPVNEVALAIEHKNVAVLSSLPGIGKRSAEKIIAQLHGKVGAFVSEPSEQVPDETGDQTAVPGDVFSQVLDVLVDQLGHAPAQARKMIESAAMTELDISTPEKLFDAIFQEGEG